MIRTLRLGVNIDHVATIRNARGTPWPDPVRAAKLAEEAGATTEDAVRAFAAELLAEPRIGDFRVVASHQESLHSHDAVSVLTQGETFAQVSLDPSIFAGLRA